MSDNITPEELDAIMKEAIAELLNMAAVVADLQTTDAAAEEIFQICDLVAEYYQIARERPVVEDNGDGSYTTTFESYSGADTSPKEDAAKRTTRDLPGVIRTKGKPKLRLIDKNTPPKKKE